MEDQKLSVLLLVCVSAVHTSLAQWPLGPDFYNSMDALRTNLNTMNTNMETNMNTMNTNLENNLNTMNTNLENNLNTMNTNLEMNLNNMASRLQAMVEDDKARAANGVAFAGGLVFNSGNGGLGYAYNSSDGSYTQYAMDGGSPPHGYMYHTWQFGTSIRTW
ncbi:uncharacterized protein MAL13P1.336-like [Mya arenaria]|uniref:uncharacterized protein MAL13P1.336-like n=1 Tax=Mya arenaria TaxID=6604 RepID=UPI0022E6E2AF|nr:uncharacterized protein MAL13P1.336-like [Mya arenaria]XP_052784052.1 uncharacterized protein MAL13P1.336-like [Mya arenaria]